ncbi:Translocon-associated protein subunit beta [Holothuria leucospilota]|uniref:Translocon-associated protein subunit beta n=1 Tax=Holothuria leucospilota TaxID=206669 RepID=A0A9Q1BN82_HOLLE|nr:Translocon-associated protein subunit beta [Holothuria leucospilota]
MFVKMKVLSVLSVLLLVGLASSQDGARLLAAKNLLNEYLVEGKDVSVLYSIYNVGSSTAHNVALTDETFPEADFKVIQGKLSVQWERIAPGSNVTHSVILQPLKSQFFNFTSATVTYLPLEDAEEKSTYTSAPGEKGIVTLKEFDRRFSPHYMDWAVFAVMTIPPIGVPFLLWFMSKRKYESIVTGKGKKH